MIINDIYTNKILKYPLSDKELERVNNVWKFLELFKEAEVFVTDYRKKIINNIRKKYTEDEFYEYETILNKMFWNLRWLIFPLWNNKDMKEDEYDKFVINNYGNFDKIPHSLLLCSYEKFNDEKDMYAKLNKNTIFETTYYRSFINKLIIVDKKNKIIMTKNFEGSSQIFNKNYFNLLTMTILFDTNLYEKIMQNPYSIKKNKITTSNYYYEHDYAFPNINFCTYKFGSKYDRKNRITKMYYSEKPKGKYWFKLII